MEEIPNRFTANVGEEWEPQDSILMKKILAMIEYSYIALKNFPKTEKFAMAADIKRCEDKMLELIVAADNKHFKKTTLEDLDVENKKLKKYLMLAFRLKFLPHKQYKHWTELTAEIGKIVHGRIQEAARTTKSR